MTDINRHDGIRFTAARIPQCLELIDLAESNVQQIQINRQGQMLVKIDGDPNGFITDMSNIKNVKRGNIDYNESDLAGFVVVWEKEKR